MATGQQFGAPPLAPDLLRKQFQLQNNQMLAQQLMQSQQPQGQMVSGHYVAPSWTQQLAGALSPVLGQQIMRKMPEQMAELRNAQQQQILGQFGFDEPSPQQLAQGLSGGMQQSQLDQQSVNMQPAQPAQGYGAQQGPMLLPGLTPEQSQMALMTLGPEKYMEAYNKQFEPTPEQRDLAHLPANMRNDILTGTALSGATRDGMQNIMGADGRIYSIPVAGYAEAQANLQGAITGAQEGAKADLDLVKVPDGRGGEIMMPRSEAIRTLGIQQQGVDASPDSSDRVGHMPSKETVEAKGRVTSLVQQGEDLLSAIDALSQYRDLDKFLGAKTYLPAIRGTARYDFERQLEQAQSQVFLEGYERLKGGGVITDYEGSKAEKAIARLDTGQTPGAFKSALNDLREVVMSGIRRAYENAGLPVPNQYGGTENTPADQPNDIPTITSPDQLQGLPSGTVFRVPDGSLRRVP